MKIEIKKVGEIDFSKIKSAVQAGEPIEVTAFAINREDEETINNILTEFLAAINQSHLMSYLSYSTLELLANANKANAKRVYFQEKGLNILNSDDYKAGMLTFNTELTVNKKHFQDIMEAQNLFINLKLDVEDNIKVEVTNKSELTEVEFTRINEKLERAKIYNSMDEALTDIDKTEGSGLGIIIIVLMLKQLGLGRDNLNFESSNGITKVTITVPTETALEEI